MQEHPRAGSGALHRVLFALAVLVFAVPAVYVGVQVYLAMRSAYRTETAIQYTLADSVTLPGVAVFEATAVPGGGSLGYLVADGERVTGGTVLAEQYTDAAQGLERERLDRLESEISLLERSQTGAATDLSQLTGQGRQALYALLDALDGASYAGAGAAGDAFVLAQNRIQLRTGESEGFDGLLAELRAQQETLQTQLDALPTVTAGSNGYFVSAAAAAPPALDKATLDAMSAADLAALLDSGVPGPDGGAAGYIVSGFNWRFYAVCDADQAARLEGLSTVQISVPGKQDAPLKASVVELAPDEGGQLSKLVLECEVINADVLSLGQEEARIDLHTYTGIRIDRSALHIVDGERGVYVDYGGIVRFRRISAIYENENYILAGTDGAVGTENEVRLYDEIITEGNHLEDKKLL